MINFNDCIKYEGKNSTEYFKKVDCFYFTVARVTKEKTYYYEAIEDDKLLNTIVYCHNNRKRVRLWYGDRKTGKIWLEEHDIMGRIGRTTGLQDFIKYRYL